MFQLHDRTRRRLCLAAFVCVGAIPSLLVGGWCVARHLPGRAQAEADALGRQLGLVVKLEAVKHLRPGAMLYEGIELADPETGQTDLPQPLPRSRLAAADRRARPTPADALRDRFAARDRGRANRSGVAMGATPSGEPARPVARPTCSSRPARSRCEPATDRKR